MKQNAEDFFHDFRQGLMAGAEANESFQLAEFVNAVADELLETGFIDGFEFCHYRAMRGMRVDGYWFNDEGSLDLFIADFECRTELVSITKTEIDGLFKRVVNFFETSFEKDYFRHLEETSPEYGLSRQIRERRHLIQKVNFYIFSERTLSDRLKTLDDNCIQNIPAAYHIWDISRMMRQRHAKGQKEALEIVFPDWFGAGIPCLPAHLSSKAYQSYLVVISGHMLSSLYEKFGARLLEQNVRCFLQARGGVNKGIRSTIINEPQMFFAYNNGITATAEEVETRLTDNGLEIIRIKDLQIVNGGQTTASLFHTRRQDKAPLDEIFVQMKLSVIKSEESETVVPRISEYANTQNRVNAADFFSNHPFHVRMEEFSRRIWAPPQGGAQRETKWFYERARGQYADAQNRLSASEKKKFEAENPKPQIFNKTDLAKFENVWDEKPTFVNLGAQKNFSQYARRIGSEWEKSSEEFNEFYFKRVIARAIIFRRTERIVSSQSWYNGGYRANIVAYTLALLGNFISSKGKSLNYMEIWNLQGVPSEIEHALAAVSKIVHEEIIRTPEGISNVTEWCKKDSCWQRIKEKTYLLEPILDNTLGKYLVDKNFIYEEKRSARKTQKIDDGINAQKEVLKHSGMAWQLFQKACLAKGLISPKEFSILMVAAKIPEKIPSEKQAAILLDLIKKAEIEGIKIES